MMKTTLRTSTPRQATAIASEKQKWSRHTELLQVRWEPQVMYLLFAQDSFREITLCACP